MYNYILIDNSLTLCIADKCCKYSYLFPLTLIQRFKRRACDLSPTKLDFIRIKIKLIIIF